MTFGATFGRVFSPTFQPKSTASAAVSWWLSGGISAANCVAAYQAKGAADYATAKKEVSATSIGDLVDWTNPPNFDASYGFVYNESTEQSVKTPSAISIVSVAMLVYLTLYSTFQSPFCKDGAFTHAIRRNSNTAWRGNTNTDANDFTYSGGKFYVNGSLTDTATSGQWEVVIAIRASAASNVYAIGQRNGLVDRKWQGYIGAVSFYDIDISSYSSALTTAMNAL